MLSQLFLVGLAVLLPTAVVKAGGDISDETMEELNSYNLFSRCYGEDNYMRWFVAIHNVFQSCQGVASPIPAAIGDASPGAVRSVRLAALGAPGAQFAGWPAGVAPATGGWGNLPWSPYLLAQPSYGRKKRQVVGGGLLKPTQEQIDEFAATALKMQSAWPSKVGNLTCVLTKMNWLDADRNVNLQQFTVDKWNQIGPNGAAKDPAFVEKMKEGYTKCYDKAQSLPESSLQKYNGQSMDRQKSFFKCAKKLETQVCAQAQALEHLEKLYGTMSPNTFPELKGDLYEAAGWALKVKKEMKSEEEKMVDRFFLKGSPY